MTVLMAPNWQDLNPYQQLLAQALARRGVEINFPKGYRRVFPLLRAVRSVQPPVDVLHLHWHEAYVRSRSLMGQAIYAAKLAVDLIAVKATGCRLVWTLHNEVPHDARYPALFRVLQSNLAKLADGIVVHSQAALDSARMQLKTNADKVEIIPHGQYLGLYGERISRDDARRLLGLPQDGRLLLFFGLIYPYKGVEDLLLAWRNLGAETHDAHLLIVGHPESESYGISISAQTEGLSNVFLRSKFVPEKEVRLYFSAADCAVLPFRRILTSGSLSLALGYSIPVIVPDFPTVRSEVTDEDGWYFRPGDIPSLESSIRTAIKSPLRATTRRNTGQLWDWDSVASATHKVYLRARRQSNRTSTNGILAQETDDTIDPEPEVHISAESGPDVDVARADH